MFMGLTSIRCGTLLILTICLWLFFIPQATVLAQEASKPLIALDATPPSLRDLVETENPMRYVLQRFSVDLFDMNRIYDIPSSAARFSRMKKFYSAWLAELERLDFDSMNQDGRIDYLLFKNLLAYKLKRLDLDENKLVETKQLLPFADTIISLQESRRRMEPVDPVKAATVLNDLKKQVAELQKELEEKCESAEAQKAVVEESTAVRAASRLDELLETLADWFGFYNGYDPLFTWWVYEPYKEADQALQDYSAWLRDRLGGGEDRGEEAIVGDPVGRDILMSDLAYSMIPYSPEELIAIGEAEYYWCEAEMVRASRELGYGDDWLEALEYVKTLHVEPGEQPELIRKQALEAIRFLEDRDLVTIPRMAKDTWRMDMMTPERQLVNPFFTGGWTISVSFPTNTMAHEDKLMSLRGNNIHFARATVQHELIPGHHLQGYMMSRYNTHRRLFYTPFWLEGWALYWEMQLWDQGFPQSPENRIGMLFWRMHRCARIIFSLNFHLGKMTAEECIDYLVERVGHERANAAAEVRRSFATDFEPLYQAAYMIGGLQFRALHKELVESGAMTDREFHDTILRLNNMPVEMVRAALTNQELTSDFKPSWKFYGEIEAGEDR